MPGTKAWAPQDRVMGVRFAARHRHADKDRGRYGRLVYLDGETSPDARNLLV